MQKTTENEEDFDHFPIILDGYNGELSVGSVGYYVFNLK
jgi:hypothetical protein